MYIPIISSVIDGVSNYFTKDQEIKKVEKEGKLALAKVELESKTKIQIAETEAKIQRLAKEAEQDYDLDKESIKDMKDSWKDEYVLLIHSAPLILSFVPSTQPYIEKGFQIIDSTIPSWFVALYVGMVVTIYGLRSLLKFYLKMLDSKINMPGK